MLIVLPPSETKAHGGDGPPLNWDRLSFSSLNPRRKEIVAALAGLPVGKALTVLGISEKLRPEAEENTRLFSGPTMPAIERYTGVLYDALGASTLPPQARERLAVGSALFGLLRADDLIPHYRLSASTKLPDAAGATPTMKARWGTAITEALSEVSGLVVDLRSGGYQQLGRYPGALTVRVESVREDGTRKVVSHFNKHYKGQLARVLALGEATPSDAVGVAQVARKAGMTVEEASPTELTLVV
ncbi:peroxide stress protein YaaA [Corynebacterium sp. zg-331]|uniref:peroxide stress protein YaaA n=1 Tax=unclassified Corynebacterium TaxID=2624378 RepID=UPI00128C6F90|nr:MULTISPECIES: peroxide stress protein YaaA [unclassified Corynebacterium]MBC3185349.1 peroxide stress protein YaaA [Corynebacterium sp. zg-331]MPV51846.1 peroxide stress protein YaaA [Corynebacterium sp. zg331]